MKKLYRTNDGQIGGVCSGIANFLDVDPTLIRLAFFILIFTGFPIILIYLILWILIPKKLI